MSSFSLTSRKKLGNLRKLIPSNLLEEKGKFLFDKNYNPQFEYEEEETLENSTYTLPSFELYELSRHILDGVIKQFGTEEDFLHASEGELISLEKTKSTIADYLQKNTLKDRISQEYSSQYIARTSLVREERRLKLRIRLPVEYRERNLQGVLNHEVGTHAFRWLNEMKRPWFGKRKSFQMQPHLLTEEGIATINYLIEVEHPYLWMQAIYYYASIYGSQHTFSELFSHLKKYMKDEERRWRTCFRVKRGVRDTSQPAVFAKDQIYLQGVVTMLRWLNQHRYDPRSLYIGKVSLEDAARFQSEFAAEELLLPEFLQDFEQSNYRQKVERIIKLNKLSSYLNQ